MNAQNSCPANDCCAGVADATPRTITNPPGLDAVSYRIGAQGDFKAAMLDALSRADAGPLRALQTREDDDFTVALIDGWATALDVLTFYQERLANEGWLGTAADRRSIVELGRLIGYEPHPGLAAETMLAFTLEDATGAPSSVTVEAGTAVQSIPAPGEQPVTFETVESTELRPEWNTVRPQQYEPYAPLDPYAKFYWVDTATPGVRPGDVLMILTNWVFDDKLRYACRCLKRVLAVQSDPTTGRSRLDVDDVLPFTKDTKALEEFAIIVLGIKTGPFGHNAPLPPLEPLPLATVANPNPSYPSPPRDWSPLFLGNKIIALDREFEGIPRLARMAIIHGSGKPAWDWLTVSPLAPVSLAQYGIAARVTEVEIFDPYNQKLTWLPDRPTFQDWRTTTFYIETRRLPLAGAPLLTPVAGSSITLDRDYYVHPVRADEFDQTPGYYRSAFLPGRRWLVRGQAARIHGDTGTGTFDNAEILTLINAEQVSRYGPTRLHFSTSLAREYVPASVTLTPNLIRATHGETVGEILGAGNGGQPWQQFTLRQGPVTFTGDGVAVNGASTLEIQANGLLWREHPSFIDAGPNDRVFTTATDENARTQVRFGDGRTGARLPSGVNNVRAIYRKGSGAAGNVRAGQLSLLGSRPAGVRVVTNPLPASGGVDAEGGDDARVNVPVAARTFDRVVSLQDYADYARAFAGVSRASAKADDGRVLLSVVGPGGADLFPKNQAKDPAVIRLTGALRRVGDPTVPLQIVGGRRYPVTVNATLRIAPDRVVADVLTAARGALLARFGFDHREIGDLFARIDLLATLQQTPGVLVATVTKFDYPNLDGDDVVWPELRDNQGVLLPAWIAWLDETQLKLTAS